MQRNARLTSKIASAGFALVFVALIACTIWAAITIRHAAERARADVTSSALYELVERQLWTEASLVRVHGLDAQGSGWYEERAAAIATDATLEQIGRSDNERDRKLARQTLADHERYIDVLLVLFSQIDAGAPEAATTYKRAGAIFESMQGHIDERATQEHDSAMRGLDELSAAQDVIVRTMIVACGLGALLIVACLWILHAYRRNVEAARTEQVAQLERVAVTDALTGLGNHRAYQEELEREIARIERHGGTLSLAVLDIDNFKAVNDGMGHLHGDRVLIEVGRMLSELRKVDRAFRLGGDEFSIILPFAGTADAVSVMDRIRLAAPGRLCGATLSIGLSSMTGNDRIDAISLRAQADAALYAAKQLGRNTVITYADAHHRALAISPEKEQGVKRLISDGGIDVVFQPIWDVDAERPLGYEALVRPDRRYGLLGPQEAFDVAERIGQAVALDGVCLRAIFARVHEVPVDALLFVNIVPNTLDSELFSGDRLLDALAGTGVSPARIVLEITERAMPRLEVIVREAQRLQALGFRLALDDTGAGNAGLDVLRQLAVDFVKIDRTVLIQAMSDPIARTIVAGIVEIAHAKNSYVIAEGIETTEALDFVCHTVVPRSRFDGSRGVQGYLLGMPSVAPWEMPDLARYDRILEASAKEHV